MNLKNIRAAANSVLTSESEEEPTVNLKDLLGNERDALLASESFWDRFTQPTKEEELLREEKERLSREVPKVRDHHVPYVRVGLG